MRATLITGIQTISGIKMQKEQKFLIIPFKQFNSTPLFNETIWKIAKINYLRSV